MSHFACNFLRIFVRMFLKGIDGTCVICEGARVGITALSMSMLKSTGFRHHLRHGVSRSCPLT